MDATPPTILPSPPSGPSTPPPRTIKLCIIGDAGVGKTCLRQRYLTDAFSLGYRATIGADFISKAVVVDGTPVLLSIWDTAGQDRFRSLGTSFYRGSDACLLLYSTTSPSSLASLRTWFDEFCARCPVDADELRDFAWVAVGTKADLARQVGVGEVDKVLRELIPTLEVEAEEEGYAVPSPGTITPSEVPPPLETRTKQVSMTPSLTATMRSSATQASIYHTPSSSLHLSSPFLSSPTPSQPSSTHSTHSPNEESDGETIIPNSPPHDHSSCETSLDADPSEEARERARGVDMWMSSSPPRAPATLRSSSGVRGLSDLAGGEGAEEGEAVGRGDVGDRMEEGVKGFVTSAKSGEGVEEMFEYVVRKVLRRWEREEQGGRADGGEVVKIGEPEGKKGWRGTCCY